MLIAACAKAYGLDMGEPVSLFTFFVSAASAFGKLTAWLRNTDREQREATAGYFDQVAACLREVAERIETGKPPRDTCRRLAVYANELEGILGRHRNLTAAGDLSIDETRRRLTEELRRTQNRWVAFSPDPIKSDIYLLSHELAEQIWRRNNRYSLEGPPQTVVDNLEREFIERAGISARARVQDIWDAAGEFAALADALRAR
jgi:hypothetical protein